MLDVEKEIDRISNSDFFYKMGESRGNSEGDIYVPTVGAAFVTPSDTDFVGMYNDVEWLPTAHTQDDPFYKFPEFTTELVDIRLEMNKAVMASTRGMYKRLFKSGAHDFSTTARNGICYAFRQYAAEQYFATGDHWKIIVSMYYAGRWPVGYCQHGLVLI